MQIDIYTSVSKESNMALWTSDCILSRSKGTHKGPNSGQADRHPRNPAIRSSRVIRNSSLGGWKIWYYSLKSCISGACWFHVQEKQQISGVHYTMIYFIQIYDYAFYLSSIPVEDACNFFLKTVNNLWGNWGAKK